MDELQLGCVSTSPSSFNRFRFDNIADIGDTCDNMFNAVYITPFLDIENGLLKAIEGNDFETWKDSLRKILKNIDDTPETKGIIENIESILDFLSVCQHYENILKKNNDVE